jgi:hypothetical protein
MARHDGASCDVNLHAIVLTVINTIPTPVHTQTKFRVKTNNRKKIFSLTHFRSSNQVEMLLLFHHWIRYLNKRS